MAAEQIFRFRPRYLFVPYAVGGLGLVLLALGLFADLDGSSRTFTIIAGAIGPLIALLYLLSPAWKLEVVVSDEALVLRRPGDIRFTLPWTEVKEVVHNAANKVLFVDGGEPARSLLVPGPGLPAPYRIDRREALYDAILARVAPEKLKSS